MSEVYEFMVLETDGDTPEETAVGGVKAKRSADGQFEVSEGDAVASTEAEPSEMSSLGIVDVGARPRYEANAACEINGEIAYVEVVAGFRVAAEESFVDAGKGLFLHVVTAQQDGAPGEREGEIVAEIVLQGGVERMAFALAESSLEVGRSHIVRQRQRCAAIAQAGVKVPLLIALFHERTVDALLESMGEPCAEAGREITHFVIQGEVTLYIQATQFLTTPKVAGANAHIAQFEGKGIVIRTRLRNFDSLGADTR